MGFCYTSNIRNFLTGKQTHTQGGIYGEFYKSDSKGTTRKIFNG